jgi:hypothetical protein
MKEVMDFSSMKMFHDGQAALYGRASQKPDCAILTICRRSKLGEIKRVGVNFMKTLGLAEPIFYW